jgi:hypothetical protein
MNTSATGGTLTPDAPPAPCPLEDVAFEDFLEQIILGLTSLPGKFVFPRWQPVIPNTPPNTVDWAAWGITVVEPDTYGVELHSSTNDGASILIRHETVEVLLSFYGPHSSSYASIFRDGLQVAQNREVLTVNGMGLIETQRAANLSELIKNLWYRRVDIVWRFRRQTLRAYSVLNLLSAQGIVYTDTYPTSPPVVEFQYPITVTNPPTN